MMSLERAIEWTKARRWWVALLVVVIAGYSIGKDIAQRENARDTTAQARGA